MTSIRTDLSGFSPFGSSSQADEPKAQGGGISREGRACLAAGLQALYTDMLSAPLPDRIRDLLEQLDASARRDAP